MSAVHAEAGPASPWKAKERVTLAVLLAIGVLGLVAGYVGTSGTLRVSHQVVWIDLAGAGLLVSGAGVVLFLTAGRRAVGQRRLGLFGNVAGAAAEAAPADTAAYSATDLVSAPTMTKYHRGDCSFVADKAGLAPGTAVAHEKVGRKPCGVCLPGGAS
ncbi:MAG TPA: hypothetical protein VHL53_08820 [Acidimicrobiia bacterium]|nr:hypothetical protein [Acidimicrobiia bacterium]